MRKELGKIENIWIGQGGYDNAMFGLTTVLAGKGWGVQDFIGTWSTRLESAQWTEEQQKEKFTEAILKVKNLLKAAKKQKFEELIGVPIEASFDTGGRLSEWRVLEEVI